MTASVPRWGGGVDGDAGVRGIACWKASDTQERGMVGCGRVSRPFPPWVATPSAGYLKLFIASSVDWWMLKSLLRRVMVKTS